MVAGRPRAGASHETGPNFQTGLFIERLSEVGLQAAAEIAAPAVYFEPAWMSAADALAFWLGRALGRPPLRGGIGRAPLAGVVVLAVFAVAIGWFLPLLGITLVAFLAIDLALAALKRARNLPDEIADQRRRGPAWPEESRHHGERTGRVRCARLAPTDIASYRPSLPGPESSAVDGFVPVHRCGTVPDSHRVRSHHRPCDVQGQ